MAEWQIEAERCQIARRKLVYQVGRARDAWLKPVEEHFAGTPPSEVEPAASCTAA
jgi:hypothetical protein